MIPALGRWGQETAKGLVAIQPSLYTHARTNARARGHAHTHRVAMES